MISVPNRGGSLLFPDSHLLKLTYFVTNSLYHRPFIAITQKTIRHFIKHYCNDLVFSLFKIGNLFGVKEPVPDGLRSRVVYKFVCAGCNASTGFPLKMKEVIHIQREKPSLNQQLPCKSKVILLILTLSCFTSFLVTTRSIIFILN